MTLADNGPQKLKINEELIREFMDGHLQASVERKLALYFESRPELLERVVNASGDGFLERLRIVQKRSSTSEPASEPTRQPVQPSVTPAHDQKPSLPTRHVAVDPRSAIPAVLANYQGYKVVRELGRGGMGVVYLAKNIQMDRLEVLKVLNERLLDHPGAKERFLREIRAVSKLSHANIVTSYSILTLDNLLVFAMEYVPGTDLHRFIQTHNPLPIDQCCGFARQLAAGLQHAHLKGLVHRDIKPSNAIIFKTDNRLHLKILDFGLSKATSEEAATGLTQDGTMLGTPEYMSPEQILDAARADIRADIYSLGCTLYHMLTGKPPFTGTHGSILMAHSQSEPKPVNIIRPEVPLELVAVLNKMLAKQPAKRFQTPAEVVNALAPFIKHRATSDHQATSVKAAESITSLDLASAERDTSVDTLESESVISLSVVKLAAPVSLPQALPGGWKYAPQSASRPGRLNQSTRAWLLASVVAVSLVLLAAGLWRVSSWMAASFVKTPNPALLAVAEQALEQANAAPTESESASASRPATESEPVPAMSADVKPVVAQPSIDTSPAAPLPIVDDIEIPVELQNVGSVEAGTMRAKMLHQARRADNTETGNKLVRQLYKARWPIDQLNRNSIPIEEQHAAGGGDSTKAPAELVAVIGNSRWKSPARLAAMDTSVDRESVVTGSLSGVVTFWNPANGQMQAQIEANDGMLIHVKLNRNGTKLLTCGADRQVKLWDVDSRKLIRQFEGHTATVMSSGFSIDENRIYSADQAKNVMVWDASSGALLKSIELSESPQEMAIHSSLPRLALACTNGKVIIVDPETAQVVEEITLGTARVSSVDFSPNGKYIAAGLDSGDVNIWESDKAYRPWRQQKIENPPINSIHFSRDSKVLAIGGRLQCWLWELDDFKMTLHHDTHDDVLDVVPLGDRWLAGWTSRWIAMFDRNAKVLNADSAPITGTAISPDGGAIAVTVRDAEQVQVWTLSNPPQARVLPGQTQWDNAIGYATDGRTLYTAGGNWHAKVWDLQKGMQQSPFKHHENWILELDVASDGKQLSTCAYDTTTRLWNIGTGEQLWCLKGHSDTVVSSRYSPDASKIITASRDGFVKVWSSQSGESLLTLPKSDGPRRAAMFRPFSQEVAATDGNSITFYALRDGKVVRSLVGHTASVYDFDFSLDGKMAVTCSMDGSIRLWDVETGQSLRTVQLHTRAAPVSRVKFAPDGRHAFSINGNGTCYVLRWNLF